MRRWILVSLVLASSALAFGGAAQDVANQLQQAFPEVRFFTEGRELAQVYGTEFGYGLSPEASADNFVRTFGELFGVAPGELLPGNAFNAQYTQPLMYNEETGTYRCTMVCYRQYRDGLPVYGADLRLLVVNAPGYPLVLANSTLHDLGDYAVPAGAAAHVNEGAAHAAAAAFQPGLSDFGAAELVIWPDPDGTPRTPKVALTFVGAGTSPGYEPLKWRFVCDAASGEVLHAENLILFTDVTGNVSGMATTIPKAEQCNPEVATVMPYAKVAIGSTTAYADASGNFTIPNGGSSPVTVTSYLSGYRFTVDNVAGSEETLTLSVTPPGPANFMHNQANTSEAVRAQVNAYVQANLIRDWVLVQDPDYPTISTQTSFPLYVMCTDIVYCPGNAWYDGSSLNFCAAGSSYGDTAFSSVVHHEYGHHIVDCGGAGQDQYGEGVGDTVAVLLSDDHVLAYGFYYDNCDTGIRDAENNMQYPCTSDIHTCAQLLSGCIWSTRNDLANNGHADFLAVLSMLMVNSVPMHGSSGSITPAIGTTFLTLDNTYYGGAHADHITVGFGAHAMIPGPPPANDACADAVVACPGTYNGSTGSATVDGSASCGSSNSTPDVWYKYTPVSSGTLALDLCDSSYNTVVSVHTGCPGTSGNQVGCNDNAGWFQCSELYAYESKLSVSVTGGNTYYIRVSGASGETGAFSLDLSGPACAPSDTTPPTPNPMTFAVPPAPTSASAISMTATTATDATPPVQYEFNFVSGGSGGNSSSWQSSTQYTDSGLSPDTAYTYRVRARDSVSPPNVGNYSGNATATTWANVPAAPTLTSPTAHEMNLDVNPNGNPGTTVFAVRCTASSPVDANWDGKYVNTSGQPSATAVWQTDAQWDNITISGLQPSTSYTFAVKARNQQGVETAFGPGATLSTAAAGLKGDLNCDGTVDFGDINPFILALSNPIEYGNMYPGCPILNGDINDDSVLDFGDINPFVTLLVGP